MRQSVGVLFLLMGGAAGGAQEPAAVTAPVPVTAQSSQAQVQFSLDRAGMDVSHYVISVHEDGSGTYEATALPATLSSRYGTERAAAAPEQIHRELHLSSAGTAKIFAGAHAMNLFRASCASKAKNIADTGRKMLSYEGPEGRGSCVYNYSDSKTVTALTEHFQGLAYTIDEGRRLEFRHRYDRLGLDQEMATLLAQSDAGRAPELGVIAPVLESLVADGDLLERVRLRARTLLERAQAGR